MLMPAAVMVVIVLGAFAVDATLVFLGEREVANLAAGMANDIAGAAVDQPVYYDGGSVAIDPERAERVRELALDTYTPQYLRSVQVDGVEVAADQVTVRVSASVRYLFSAALPAVPDHAQVSASSTATARQD
jgi:hypothetical protein